MKNSLNHRDEVEQALQHSFAEYAVTADDHVWAGIQDALHPEKKRRAIWWMWGAAAGVAGTVFVYSLDLSRQNTEGSPEKGQAATEIPATEQPGIQDNPINHQEQFISSGEDQETPGDTNPAQNRSEAGTPVPSITHTRPSKEIPGNDEPLSESPADALATLDKMPGRTANISMRWEEPVIEKRFFPIEPSEYAVKKDKGDQWMLAANFGSTTVQHSEPGAGGAVLADGLTQGQNFENQGNGIAGIPNADASYTEGATAYHQPLIVGIRGSLALGRRLSIESGISYTRITSTAEGLTGTGRQTVHTARLQYIGLPLMLNYRFINKERLSLYSASGVMLDKGISEDHTLATLSPQFGSTRAVPGAAQTWQAKTPGLQGGLALGLGVDYRLSRLFSIYVQPSVTSWLINIDQGPNGRNEKLLWPNLQTGVRLNF